MEQKYNEQEIAEHYIGIIKSKRKQGFTDEQIAKDIGFPLETVQRVNTNDVLPENPNEKEDEELPMDMVNRNESVGGEQSSQNDNRTTDRDNGSKEVKEVPKGGTYSVPKKEIAPRKMGSGEVEGIQNTEESSSESDSNNAEKRVGTPNQIHGENNIQESESEKETSEIGEEQKENMGSSNSDKDKIDVKEEYTLEQSAEDMFSDDVFKQLKAEFAQAKIRHNKLFHHIGKVMLGEEEDVMPLEMLQIKADALQAYLTVLGVQMTMVKRMEKEIKNEEDK